MIFNFLNPLEIYLFTIFVYSVHVQVNLAHDAYMAKIDHPCTGRVKYHTLDVQNFVRITL